MAIVGLLPSAMAARCPASWLSACPQQDCLPLPGAWPAHEVMAFRGGYYGCGAACYMHSWQRYNHSVVTTVLNGDLLFNLTQIACAQHARGGRVTVGLGIGFGAFDHARLYDADYRAQWIATGVKAMVAQFPFVDGVNVDLEHFPRNFTDPSGMTALVCGMDAALRAHGLRVSAARASSVAAASTSAALAMSHSDLRSRTGCTPPTFAESVSNSVDAFV